ncbi:TadE/TadG family type IV pilus assembly protein [Nitratireductor sp. ZSWI3]|uniref:TadE/TadG family type IV pilus assembly protein n=1 Tax=Nitratireductor sp. ZSWI3 TaxID=2966359 RepID=UPI00214F6B12|nr:TadE/TadG family type IV pilus assembly protein [Nitratireductor sp. ZSWI3]MCR4268297.1 pilus assembly protein [Nitratireductor sp. ZSWI3]
MTHDQSSFRQGRGVFSTLRRFLDDRRGVAAVEFVFIAPVLFALYFLTLEFAQAIDTNKKISRIGSMVGDLVAQQPSITPGEVDAIMKIGGSLLNPYKRSAPEVMVTAIRVTDETTPKVEVVWSRKLVGSNAGPGLPAGTGTTIPDNLKVKGAFYIRATAELGYQPIITWSESGRKSLGLMAMLGLDNMEMSERYYLRPRMSSTIPCQGC